MIDRIDCYWDLSASERKAVEEYVRAHPDLGLRLEQAKALGRLIDLAANHFTDRDLIARYAGRALFGESHGLSDEEIQRVEEVVRQNPSLGDLLEEYRSRLETLVGEHDPVRFFEQLSAHPEGDQTDRSATPHEPVTHYRPHRRQPGVGRRWPLSGARTLVAAAITLGVLIVAIEVFDQSDSRMAEFAVDEVDNRRYDLVLRSEGDPNISGTDSLFVDALITLQEAERSFFGAFKRYDAATIRLAKDKLEKVIEMEDNDTFVALEARYLLAKILIYERRFAGAEDQLDIIIDREGARMESAIDLRESIRSMR